MFTACLQHCRYLSLSQSKEDEAEFCAGNALNCHRYREKLKPDAERQAMEDNLKQLFRLDELTDRTDMIALIEAITSEDKTALSDLLADGISPPVDWLQIDYAGVGSDWGGTRISIVYRLDHPHLKAALGLVLNTSEATLTLGRIEYANAAAFCRLTPAASGRSYRGTGHVAGDAETKPKVTLL